MAFIYSIKDSYRAMVEAATGGKNTVMYDDKGNPSIMVVVPRFNISDVIDGAPATPHPMFIVNGQTKDAIYASKFQNVMSDSRAYSLPMQDPATYTTFDQALTYCKNKGQGWHLLTNAEWAGIALWCKKNGFMPRGNNNFGSDISAPHEKGKQTYFDAGNGKTGRVATGSGPMSWAHDNSNEGIFDLNGNINEWVGGLRLNNGEIQIIKDNDAAINTSDQSSASALWRGILQDGSLVVPGTADTLKYDNTTAGDSTTTSHDVGGDIRVNTSVVNPNYIPGGQVDYGYSQNAFEILTAVGGVTIPDIIKALALFPLDSSHGGDNLYVRNYGERLPIRGGYWSGGSSAGVFYLYLSNARSNSSHNIGFRSAFVL